MTYPLVWHLSSAMPHDLGDPLLSTTLLWWNAHTTPLTDRWWDGLWFWPAPGSVAFSDHRLGESLMATPLQWFGLNAVTAANLTLLADLPAVGAGGALARVHDHAPARCRDSLRSGIRLLPVPYRAPAASRTAGRVRHAGRARGAPPLSRHIRVAMARRPQRRADRPGVVHELLPAVLFRPAGVLGVLVHRMARHRAAGGHRPVVRGCDRRSPAGAERLRTYPCVVRSAALLRRDRSAQRRRQRPRRRVAFDRAVGMDREMGAPGRRALSRIDDRRRRMRRRDTRMAARIVSARSSRQVDHLADGSRRCVRGARHSRLDNRPVANRIRWHERFFRRAIQAALSCGARACGLDRRIDRGCGVPTPAARRWRSTASRRRCCFCAPSVPSRRCSAIRSSTSRSMPG